MISRCYNIKNKSYRSYGAKGVSVCKEWLENFDNFKKDMGSRPSAEHSIDRINPHGNYEPSNCRWADKETQNKNKRKKHAHTVGDENDLMRAAIWKKIGYSRNIEQVMQQNERYFLHCKYIRELREAGKNPTVNINKLARFFNRASKKLNCEINAIRIFRRDIIIADYLSGKREIRVCGLDKCKAWADANGVHFGEVTDYIEVDNG